MSSSVVKGVGDGPCIKCVGVGVKGLGRGSRCKGVKRRSCRGGDSVIGVGEVTVIKGIVQV